MNFGVRNVVCRLMVTVVMLRVSECCLCLQTLTCMLCSVRAEGWKWLCPFCIRPWPLHQAQSSRWAFLLSHWTRSWKQKYWNTLVFQGAAQICSMNVCACCSCTVIHGPLLLLVCVCVCDCGNIMCCAVSCSAMSCHIILDLYMCVCVLMCCSVLCSAVPCHVTSCWFCVCVAVSVCVCCCAVLYSVMSRFCVYVWMHALAHV